MVVDGVGFLEGFLVLFARMGVYDLIGRYSFFGFRARKS